MNEFLIELQAILDREASKGNINKSIGRLQNQLDKLKVQAELDPKAVQNLAKEIERVINHKITISNIELDEGKIIRDAQKTGQQVGNAINQGFSKGLSNNSSVLENFKKSLQKIGMGSKEIDVVAERINKLNIQIESLNQSKSHSIGKNGDKDILSVNISGIDEMGQAIKLTQQYDSITGNLLKTIDSVSTAQQKAVASIDSSAKQQSRTISNLTNQINQLNRAANDQNASRPISDSSHLNSLSNKYNDIISAIERMKNASNDTFTAEENNARTLISEYKSMVSEFKNAENVSSNLKGTDLTSGLSIARNNLEKFKSDAKDFPQITQTINELDTAIANVGDASSLNNFNDQLRVARSELAKIKSETNASNRNKKVGIDISGLQSKIADIQRISPEINTFKTEIDSAEVSVQSLYEDISKINTSGDFSVIKKKVDAFEKAAQAAGIAVTDTSSKTDALLQKIDSSITSHKYTERTEKITQDYNKTDSSLIDDSLKNDYVELIDLSNKLNTSMSDTDKINTYNRLEELLPSVKNRLSELSSAQNDLNKINDIKDKIDNGKGVSDYQNRIDKYINDFERYGVATERAISETKSLQQILDNMKGLSGKELISEADKLEKEFKSVKISLDSAKQSYDKFAQPVSHEKATSLINRINSFLTKNTKITQEPRAELERYVQEINDGVNLGEWNEISGKLKETENSMRGLGKLGASFKNQMSQAAESFTQWMSISSGIMMLVSKTKESITEIKNLDNILTEISKTSDLTDQQLKQLGLDAYDSASKYGRTASDYLTGVQEMARSGFYGKKGTAMSESSLLAQSSGDMDAELANNYILATNAAYKLNGEADKLNAVLDGQNSINKMVALYRNI